MRVIRTLVLGSIAYGAWKAYKSNARHKVERRGGTV